MKTVAKFASRFQFWISRQQLAWLEAEAQRQGYTMGEILRRLIDKARS